MAAIDPGEILDTAIGTLWLLAVMAGIFVPLEGWRPRGSRITRVSTLLAIGALLVLNTCLLELAGRIAIDPLSRATTGEASIARGLLVFVLAELAGYAIHRAMHRVPLLWRFHRLHHGSTEPTFIEAWLQHPVDFVLHGLVVALPGALLGASLSEIVTVVLLRKLYTTWLHANVAGELPLLEGVIATPAFHRLHHAGDPRLHDCNFAGTFPVLDRLFGTAAPSGAGRKQVG